MDMLFTAEQESMAASLTRYLEAALPREVLHRADRPGLVVDSLATDEYWSGLTDLGLFALTIAEAQGGAGLGLADQVALFRELGRKLAVGPIIGTVLAAEAAAAGSGNLLDHLIGGGSRAAVAFRQLGTDLEVGSRVVGTIRVHDLQTADYVLVLDADAVAIVPSRDLEPVAIDAIDPTAPVTIARVDAGATLLRHDPAIHRRGTVLQAAVFCGLAEAARDNSAAYVKTREQFGKPIGAFQAVKHRCAEMAVRAEVAFFQTVYAALVEDEGHANADFHASSAHVVARDAARHNAADNIQNHGGMGFTAEAEPYLYMRRQLAYTNAFGSRRAALEVVASSPNPL
jgi:Acyl-CoA dehydrogenases